MNNKVRFSIALIVVIAFGFLVYMKTFHDEAFNDFDQTSINSDRGWSKSVKSRCRPWFEWIRWYRQCLLEKLSSPNHSAWHQLHNAEQSCLGQSTFDMMGVNWLPNNDDVKLAILPSTHSNSKSECVQVTLGVGNDVESEKKLKRFLPNCRLFGADPMITVGRVFETVGRYYEMAVGAKSGQFNASVLVGPGIYDYATKIVPTTAFIDFLLVNVKHKKIDYLFMDNEGAEYDILPLFVGDNSTITQNGIVVCQLSVELHGPLPNYKMTESKYDQLIRNLISNSSLVPVWSTQPANHVRMFLLNGGHEYCILTYLQKWCAAT